MSMREAKNEVTIEGILSEIDLKYGSFQKDGRTIENVGGTIKIRVDKDGQVNEIPVSMYSNKLTKAGSLNPAYSSIERVMNEYVSIAACGDPNAADCVRITRAKITMNEYYSQSGNLVSYPRVQASFVNRIKREELNPKADFEIEFCIGKMGYKLDKEGCETEVFEVQGIVPQWGGKVDVVTFHTASKSVTDVISQAWEPGESVYAAGRLNFSSMVEKKIVKMGFGEREETKTVNISELLISGGDDTPLEDEFAFPENEIQAGLADRKARLEQAKAAGAARASQRRAPAPSNTVTAEKGFDLGF